MTDDPDLTRLLDAWAPPPLPAGFADRLDAHIAATSTPLPSSAPRRHRLRGWGRWPRLAAGATVIGLMTATAAAGVFGDVGITIPAWQRTVEKATGMQLAERPAAPVAPKPAPIAAPASPDSKPSPSLRDIFADGKIESRAELEAASAALEARRDQRRILARDRREARVDAAIEDRRARGLPVPSDEALAAGRARRDARAARRAEAVDARRTEVEAGMGKRLDNGESVDLHQLATPEARAERRERMRAWREQRRERMEEPGPSPPSSDLPSHQH